MKNFILLLLFQLTVIAVGQPLKELIDIDATSRNIAHKRVHRYSRALKTDPPACSFDKYFDAEGRYSNVTGGGRVLYINSTNSCGADGLQPHCTSTRYYYICKNSKTILAQCIQGQQFENHLQKCVVINSDDLISSTVQPNQETYESIQLPECKRLGSFPVPDDCTLFYTCETNGDQILQNIFRCPKGMTYNTETKMCSTSSSCENTNSVEAFCASVILKQQNVEKTTNTETSTHITDSDEDDKAVEDTTLANIVPVTYNNNEPVSTVSFNDLIPTEFTEFTVHVDVITERASNNLRFSDTKTSTAYSATNEKELLLNEEINRFMETTTFMDMVLNEEGTTPNDREIQTTGNSMVTTEETAEELISKVTVAIDASKIAPTDLSTPSSREIQSTEVEKNESMKDSTSSNPILNDEYDITETSNNANAEIQPPTNDPILKGSPLKDFKLNKKSITTVTSLETTINPTKEPDERTTDGIEQLVESSTAMIIIKEPFTELTTLNENENNILSTTDSSNENTKPTFLKNVDTNHENAVTEAESLNKHSLVTDKQNATSNENDITGKESVIALKTTQPTMRVSTDVILPIMSVLLAIVDTLERFFIHIFSRMQG